MVWTTSLGADGGLMDVRLSAEQQGLQDAAARLVDQLGPKAPTDVDDPERVAKLEAAMAGTGWRELRTATDGVAPLTSGVEPALVAEQLGRGLADVPYFGPTMASELRRMADAPTSAEVETVLLTADLTSIAVAVDGVVRESVAIDTGGSRRSILLVSGPKGRSLAEVDLGAPSRRIDLTRPSVAIDSPVGVKPIGANRMISDDDLERWTALGLALACADLVGTMFGAVQLAIDYASQRRQFGVTIGSFQAIQHLLADAFVLSEGSRSAALHAAWGVDVLPAAEALAAAATAKAYCARSARTVCETAIQVHGGVGNTWECLAHIYLRRALLSGDLLGDAGVCLDRMLRHRGIEGVDGLR
jgi:hypothetical protein